MDTTVGAASPITGTLGGERLCFNRLSKRDLATIRGVMPVENPADRKYLTEFDVHKWAATSDGSSVVLAVAMGKTPAAGESWDTVTLEVEKMGSIVQRSALASVIVAETITTGEEVPVPRLPGDEHRPDPTSTSSPKP